MASSDRFFHTYELLEPILLYLPIRAMLFAQAVSTAWKNNIKGSARLQVALFRTAISDTTLGAGAFDSTTAYAQHMFAEDEKYVEDPNIVLPIPPQGLPVNPFLNEYMLREGIFMGRSHHPQILLYPIWL